MVSLMVSPVLGAGAAHPSLQPLTSSFRSANRTFLSSSFASWYITPIGSQTFNLKEICSAMGSIMCTLSYPDDPVMT